MCTLRTRTSSRQKGSLTTMMALILPVGLAATGLVIDLGHMYSYKREMQNAADAAAVAAVQEWRQENWSSYADAAREDAALNGFDEADGAEVDGGTESRHDLFRLGRQVDGDVRDFRVTAEQHYGAREVEQVGGGREVQGQKRVVIFLPQQGAPLPHHMEMGAWAL